MKQQTNKNNQTNINQQQSSKTLTQPEKNQRRPTENIKTEPSSIKHCNEIKTTNNHNNTKTANKYTAEYKPQKEQHDDNDKTKREKQK